MNRFDMITSGVFSVSHSAPGFIGYLENLDSRSQAERIP